MKMTGDPPTVTLHELIQPDDTIEYVEGRLLGFSSSHRDSHNHPLPRDLSVYGDTWKCSACRWFEASIIHITDDETYAVYTVGRSALPGEKPRARVQFTDSAYELVEILTDRREGTPRLSVASARCLAQASSTDKDIADAYVNRAVA